MSRAIKVKYSAFQRSILREIFPESTLVKLDRAYTDAKIQRMIKFYHNQLIK